MNSFILHILMRSDALNTGWNHADGAVKIPHDDEYSRRKNAASIQNMHYRGEPKTTPTLQLKGTCVAEEAGGSAYITAYS